MSGFELRIQGVGSDRSTNLASTTAHPSPPIGGRGIPRGEGAWLHNTILEPGTKKGQKLSRGFSFQSQ